MAIKRRTTTRKRTTRRKASKKVRATGSCARDRVLKKRRTTKRITKRLKVSKRAAPKKKVGEVTHFFDRISVAVIKLSGLLKLGDKISIEGATTNFKQKVASMQIEHKPIKTARKGQSIGMKVKDRVRERDIVYKI